MGLLRDLRATLISSNEPLTSTILLNWLGGPKSSAGVNVNVDSALGITSFWRGVNVLAGTASYLDLKARRDRDRQDTTPALFTQPHPLYTWPEWVSLTFAHRMIWGDAFAYKVRSGPGQTVTALLPLDPRLVEVKVARPRGGDAFDRVKVFKITVPDRTTDEGTRDIVLDDRAIMHLPGFGYTGTRGVPVVALMVEALGSAIATTKFAGKFWGSGTLSSGFLKTDKKLRQEDATALKERWQARVAGLENAGEVAVLDAGASFESLTIPPEQAQFLQSREFDVFEMARITGVPPHLLMAREGQKWGAGLEQENLAFVLFSLRSHLATYASRFTLETLPRGQTAYWSTTALERGDTRARWGAHLIARKALAKSINEIRVEEGLPPLEDPEADDPLFAGAAPKVTQPGGNEGNEPPDGGGPTGEDPAGEGDNDDTPNEE